MGFEGVLWRGKSLFSHIMQRRELLEDFNGEFEIILISFCLLQLLY